MVEPFRGGARPGIPLEDRRTRIDQEGEPAFTCIVVATGSPGRAAFVARLTTVGGGIADSNEIVVALQKKKKKRKKGR